MPRRVIIVGGGAAGFFGAITCAESAPKGTEIQILEKTSQFLSKVRISGGGRCNVTHACFEPRELSANYPRGEHELISPFQKFSATDTIEWFEAHGVKLKTEADGRMFPTTDSSETIINCLLQAAKTLGIKLVLNCGVDKVEHKAEEGFILSLQNGEKRECERLLMATCGCRTPAAGAVAESLGHSLISPVPSLFTFHIECPLLREIPGVTVDSAEASVPGMGLKAKGPILVTHWGLSGPAILRLSAWAARKLHATNYQFPLRINWLPQYGPEELLSTLTSHRIAHSARYLSNAPFPGVPARLWEKLTVAAGLKAEARWSSLSKANLQALVQQLSQTEFQVIGKSLNKEEFVTCGGVSLKEVNFKTMESRVCPGLYFAGELLDVDAITGGFNFQAAWTTGWLAGRAIANSLPK
ncbi:MAG TPA: NAD(P)/FAD-dependent oxidoreductase [Verrucomicrobiae bacterium]